MFNKIDITKIEATRSSIFDNQVKIRKSWVQATIGTPLEIRLLSYPRKDRFALYAMIDECVRVDYVRRMREYNKEQRDLDLLSGVIIMCIPVLAKQVQMNPHTHLVEAAMSVLDKMLVEIKMA